MNNIQTVCVSPVPFSLVSPQTSVLVAVWRTAAARGLHPRGQGPTRADVTERAFREQVRHELRPSGVELSGRVALQPHASRVLRARQA